MEQAAAQRIAAQTEAESVRVMTEAEIKALHEREQTAEAHPALLRLQELEMLRELSQVANTRIYIGFEIICRLRRMDGVMSKREVIG
jgi:hypothetical protein